MNAEEMAKNFEILRLVNGSHLYGTNTETSDRDEVGVCIPPPPFVLGFQNFEQYEYSTGTDDSRNTSDDYDLTIYSVKKFAKMVADGNPSILNLLWAPESKRILWTEYADSLMEIREHVHSRESVKRFLGYMNSQILRLEGKKGKHVPYRPEIVEKYGFDTKFAMHAIRLGIQGVEFAETGKITTPMEDVQRNFLLDVRSGRYTKEEVIWIAKYYEELLERYKDDADIPKRANRKAIESILISLQWRYWHPVQDFSPPSVDRRGIDVAGPQAFQA